MSTAKFNALFAGYPKTEETQLLRRRVKAEIANSLSSMRIAKRDIQKITYANRQQMWAVIVAVGKLPVSALHNAPKAVIEVVAQLREPVRKPLKDWNLAAQGRLKRWDIRTRHGITPGLFESTKGAYVKVIDSLIAWLESVQPDGS